MLIQVFLIGLMIAALVVTWKRVRQTVISSKEGMVWSLMWLVGIIIVLLPNLTTKAAKLFGVGRGVDFIFYTSISVMFLLIFKLFIKHEHLERKLTELIRREALRDLPEKKIEDRIETS